MNINKHIVAVRFFGANHGEIMGERGLSLASIDRLPNKCR